MYQHDVETYRSRFEAFGWHARTIDGHDLEAVVEGLEWANDQTAAPAILIAHTLKGKGVSFMEDRPAGMACPSRTPRWCARALEELGDIDSLAEELSLARPEGIEPPVAPAVPIEAPDYGPDDIVATRQAYGAGLRKLGAADPRVVVLDADTKNSTYSQHFLRLSRIVSSSATSPSRT